MRSLKNLNLNGILMVQKILEAKEGKIDVDFFKNIVQKKEITGNRFAPVR